MKITDRAATDSAASEAPPPGRLRFAHVALVGKYQAQGMRDLLADLADWLQLQGVEVSLEAETARNTELFTYTALTVSELARQCDLAVVVGGDGTMLGFARQVAQHDLPLVGINHGRLGFITDVPLGQFRQALTDLLHGNWVEDTRHLIDGEVIRGGRRIFAGQALNDVVLSRGATNGMVEFHVEIGQEFVARLLADGLIVASPTGSTAYALAVGGPIVHPGLAGWVLTPIASHSLTTRPIVLPDSEEVRITVVSGRESAANFDMQRLASLLPGDVVCVRRSSDKVRFLHPRDWSYYATLREKLHWYGGGA
ncbi:NAD kinase [Amphibiibacter pelophylacis]|uniref:NAD kinase n=1 Tax=Amphibiibacter pelophylacis TaxID=1799477 RepID=A0ACC6P3Z4_9BURK